MKVEEANHGKLLWDEGEHLERHGYATSTGERVLFVMDMQTHEQVGQFNYTQHLVLPYPNYCQGTHAIAYSGQNQHIYLECTAGGGILEVDVGDPTNPVFVAQHKDATGSLYETPDRAFVVASDKGGNKLHIFKPEGSGAASSIDHVVEVPGHPSTPVFYPTDGSFVACMPLTENTNQNHFNSNGERKCDYYGCSGASTPEDVASGVCAYGPDDDRVLLSVSLENINDVKNEIEPFNAACNRCKEAGNFDQDEGGTCVCTPFCGSCADDNYDASASGVQCVNIGDVLSGAVSKSKLIANAGAVEQGSPYSYSPQCGFGRTYRTHKRGGKYDASVAHFPKNSLQIVNMKTQQRHCQVDLPGSPSRVIYVPKQPGQDNLQKIKLGSGAIIGIVAASLVVVATLIFLSIRSQGSASNAPVKGEHEGSPTVSEVGLA